MADVQFWFGGGFYGDAPVYDAASDAQETVTSAASAVNTTAVSLDGSSLCKATIVGSGEVYVAVGVGIEADADNGHLAQGGMVIDFGRVPKGSRGSAINK
jgi:hypothetical protein